MRHAFLKRHSQYKLSSIDATVNMGMKHKKKIIFFVELLKTYVDMEGIN